MNTSRENNKIIPKAAVQMREIFDENKDKRICVVGASCVGKSTLLSYLNDAVDMDDLLFGSKEKHLSPLLNKEEVEYVCGPWNIDVGNFMIKRAKELIQIKPGQPIFGTIVFPSDVLIEITVPENILKERVLARNSNFNDVLNMKRQIEEEIRKSSVEKIIIENK